MRGDWIDVRDRLPKGEGDTLVTWNGRYVDDEAFYDPRGKIWMESYCVYANAHWENADLVRMPILYWMEYPAPPEKGVCKDAI